MQGRPARTLGDPNYKWKVLFSVVFGIFMVILDTTAINVAFRTLQQEFGASVSDAQWIISVYVMALGIATPLSGFLGDRFGMKRIFLLGLSLFVLGSLLCGLAPSLPVLIGARILQGLGGGIALPLGTAQLFTAFPPEEQGTALGVFGIALVMAPALGPILGGWLVDADLWRWIFFINIPIGAVGVFLGARWLREIRLHPDQELDVLGFITSTVGFGAILYASSIAAEQGWDSSTVRLWFIVGVVSLIAFTLVELFVAKQPLLDLRLFKKPIFTLATLTGWVSVVALFAAEFLLPLYLQILRGYSAFETGLLLLPLAITSGIVVPLAGKAYDKIGARPLVTLGFAILAFNTWELSRLQVDTPITTIIWLLAIRGVALGLTVQTTFTLALSTVQQRLLSRGSALINATRNVVQSVAVALLATVLASAVAPAISEQLSAMQAAMPAAAMEATADVALCELPTSDAVPLPAAARETIRTFCEQNVLGFERAYHYTFYASLVALALGLLLPGWPFGWAGRRAAPEDGPPIVASH